MGRLLIKISKGEEMKLKTLKDLGIQGDAYLILKKEVIKWIKNCKVCFKQYHRKFCAKHEELAKFNNITDEDLK